MIRVLKFLNHFFIGGTERQFLHVTNGLDRSRFAVEAACLRREGALLDGLDPAVPLHTYPVGRTLYSRRSVFSQAQLMNDLRRRQIDIVHTYGWYPNVFAIPAARIARRRAIIASVRDAGAYMTPAKVQALKFVCRLAHLVLANSTAGRDWLVEQGVNEQKIEIIRNGIVVPTRAERKPETSRLRREFGIHAGTPVCACIGRVVSGKGMDFYLRAARILIDRGRDVQFLIIGAHSVEHQYQSDVQMLARELNLGDRVIFTGQRQDVSEILQEVDIVVHPSLTEGLSNVILEGMAAGLPIVATRVGGTPEIVEDGRTGLLVPVSNPTEIANAIDMLLAQPGMARAFGERARQRVIDEFGIDRMLSKTEALYCRLLEQNGANAFLRRSTLRES